ncbi:hypothetical protein TPHA_0C04220 [Tetrapisispora phaffii CBS 4417]|uniref:PHD-type domain-containing protein n=1 Tax=Tetrapisispora phaffii (strain ATCC 24235 / CBS 4417 / NBRC 1672 / NRRL Y-8282 / UCD 70-5) TaxID=1071381 RepID=G8BQR0_TETPH|nr:hypothetical protein TPHA_0C04220 [Tetrapisispora phaffii CBS 4417]CCE62572.1 hypothetical protein TPHA_0C04220 [Tetrapisispora phaffii CBS 4417]
MSNLSNMQPQQLQTSSSVDLSSKESTSTQNSDSDRNTSDNNGSRRGRPKRTSSKNIDYDLKKRKIIPSDTNYFSARENKHNDSDTSKEDSEKKKIPDVKLIETDENGKIININDEEILSDIKNGATGLSLSQSPTEKIKKDSLWNYKKIVLPEEYKDFDVKNNKYLSMLETKKSDNLTSSSIIRPYHKPKDIHNLERSKSLYKYYEGNNFADFNQHATHQKNAHVIKKVKDTVLKESKSKLFGQSSISAVEDTNNDNGADAIDNDDFCSTCQQSGSFLCCDTCPRSFHFLCLNPPLDPDNLPEGDWSCPQCVFKAKNPTIAAYKKSEREFIAELPNKNKLFGKLLFNIQSQNSKQFQLPNTIKDTFENVKANARGQYQDEKEKTPLTERQIFGTPYGQSITKLDGYTPELHIDPESGEFLICYHCQKTKMGTWENYETESRLIMRCDYCQTPWHLNCLPDVPRASLKNLGNKWKCPLHMPELQNKIKHIETYRRLSRNQTYVEPIQSSGFRNNGDIEIELDEIIEPVKTTQFNENYNEASIPPVPIYREDAIKLDFLDKIQKAKSAEKFNFFKTQEILIDKLISASKEPKNTFKNTELQSNIDDISSLIYFKLGNSRFKKLWNFKELCNVASGELNQVKYSNEELQQLTFIKQILESKPKEEVLKFLNL